MPEGRVIGAVAVPSVDELQLANARREIKTINCCNNVETARLVNDASGESDTCSCSGGNGKAQPELTTARKNAEVCCKSSFKSGLWHCHKQPTPVPPAWSG